jgi:hypothetical protein
LANVFKVINSQQAIILVGNEAAGAVCTRMRRRGKKKGISVCQIILYEKEPVLGSEKHSQELKYDPASMYKCKHNQ